MDGGAWWATVHGVARRQTRLSDFTFTFHFHALEKEMATHSSVLAWRSPGTAEPGGLPSMGSHRVGHDWSDLAAAATDMPLGLPWWLSSEESTCKAGASGDVSSITESGRSPGGGHGTLLQYCCLENSIGTCQATVHAWSDLACMHTDMPLFAKDHKLWSPTSRIPI